MKKIFHNFYRQGKVCDIVCLFDMKYVYYIYEKNQIVVFQKKNEKVSETKAIKNEPSTTNLSSSL